MSCIFQSKLVFQKQPIRFFCKRSIFQITDNSDKSEILLGFSKNYNNNNELKNHQRGSLFQVYCPRLKLKDQALHRRSPRTMPEFQSTFLQNTSF